jgi:hypothetical protein
MGVRVSEHCNSHDPFEVSLLSRFISIVFVLAHDYLSEPSSFLLANGPSKPEQLSPRILRVGLSMEESWAEQEVLRSRTTRERQTTTQHDSIEVDRHLTRLPDQTPA